MQRGTRRLAYWFGLDQLRRDLGEGQKEVGQGAAMQRGTRRLAYWFPAIFDACDLNFGGGLGDRGRCGKEAFRGESFQNLEIQIAFHPDCGFNVGNESMEFEVEFTRR